MAEHSAYPHPEEFQVMRPEYHEQEDGYWRAVIQVMDFKVSGVSGTKPGARRAALYQAEQTYRNYHPRYRVQNPYPDRFTDREGQKWERVPQRERHQAGDYRVLDTYGDEDYANIEDMLMWDIRPGEPEAEAA